VILNDVWRSWDNLRSTIAMAMGFSISGVSNVMTGICGDLGKLDEELCARWAQLGAFMPLLRNYYN
jgi:alpha-glucosidase